MNGDYRPPELICCAASRLIRDGETVYVGVGKPTIAAFLAKLTHAPDITIVFETGIIRSAPCELPVYVDSLATQADSDLVGPASYVNALAARGAIDRGFVGAGEVDRHGNINSTAIGDYAAPALRFPGGGGANEITALCRQTVIILDQRRQRFRQRVDFVTAPGYLDGTPGAREAAGLPAGRGPSHIVTDLAVFRFVDGIAVIDSVHDGVLAEHVRAQTGWELDLPAVLPITPPPTANELHLLRTVIDPAGRILGA